ncbi:hypothetical protein NUW54_g10909 [Trametes sanguinea]|uniref:Uncharacterized protein n=1 Tax=Trametes sanguinea TaxID=158606 RepID=A0ACC1NQG3_9APHY|nr:hypothetical protein NUW54_g10909 [Trametes sanguinea]
MPTKSDTEAELRFRIAIGSQSRVRRRLVVSTNANTDMQIHRPYPRVHVQVRQGLLAISVRERPVSRLPSRALRPSSPPSPSERRRLLQPQPGPLAGVRGACSAATVTAHYLHPPLSGKHTYDSERPTAAVALAQSQSSGEFWPSYFCEDLRIHQHFTEVVCGFGESESITSSYLPPFELLTYSFRLVPLAGGQVGHSLRLYDHDISALSAALPRYLSFVLVLLNVLLLPLRYGPSGQVAASPVGPSGLVAVGNAPPLLNASRSRLRPLHPARLRADHIRPSHQSTSCDPGLAHASNAAPRQPPQRVSSPHYMQGATYPLASSSTLGVRGAQEDSDPETSQGRPKQKRRRQALSCTASILLAYRALIYSCSCPRLNCLAECKRRKIKCDRFGITAARRPSVRSINRHLGFTGRTRAGLACGEGSRQSVNGTEKYVTRSEFDELKARVAELEATLMRTLSGSSPPAPTSRRSSMSATMSMTSGHPAEPVHGTAIMPYQAYSAASAAPYPPRARLPVHFLHGPSEHSAVQE